MLGNGYLHFLIKKNDTTMFLIEIGQYLHTSSDVTCSYPENEKFRSNTSSIIKSLFTEFTAAFFQFSQHKYKSLPGNFKTTQDNRFEFFKHLPDIRSFLDLFFDGSTTLFFHLQFCTCDQNIVY